MRAPIEFAHIFHTQEKSQIFKDFTAQWKIDFSAKALKSQVELLTSASDLVTSKCKAWLKDECTEPDVEEVLSSLDGVKDKLKSLESFVGVVDMCSMSSEQAAFRNTAEMVIFVARYQKERAKTELFDLEPDVACLIDAVFVFTCPMLVYNLSKRAQRYWNEWNHSVPNSCNDQSDRCRPSPMARICQNVAMHMCFDPGRNIAQGLELGKAFGDGLRSSILSILNIAGRWGL